ncbi:MAG TPA: sigma-70 family RNA polymerase sigma factor [Puia sp.]
MISIAEISSGDEASFTEVFHLYYAKVYHHLLKKTRSATTAREAAQLTFIKLWEFRHTLSEAVSLDTQVFHIATGALIDYLRRENTQRKKVREAVGLLEDEAGAEHDRSFESSDYLFSLTRSLSPARKKIFILSRVHGHSYKEIAAQLSISLKTVEDHMVKALRQIRSVSGL